MENKRIAIIVTEISEKSGALDRGSMEELEGAVYYDDILNVEKLFCKRKKTDQKILLLSLSEFMDACNNDEIDLSKNWVTWIRINADSKSVKG